MVHTKKNRKSEAFLQCFGQLHVPFCYGKIYNISKSKSFFAATVQTRLGLPLVIASALIKILKILCAFIHMCEPSQMEWFHKENY